MFSTNYKITFSETDPGGILFFADFFKIAHITYERFLESFNLKRNYFIDDDYAIPIINANAEYLSPVKFGDELICTVFVNKIGTTSFELYYTLNNKDQISAKVYTKHVVVRKKDFSKTSIPNDLIENFNEHLV